MGLAILPVAIIALYLLLGFLGMALGECSKDRVLSAPCACAMATRKFEIQAAKWENVSRRSVLETAELREKHGPGTVVIGGGEHFYDISAPECADFRSRSEAFSASLTLNYRLRTDGEGPWEDQSEFVKFARYDQGWQLAGWPLRERPYWLR